jgi:hypothetical protein
MNWRWKLIASAWLVVLVSAVTPGQSQPQSAPGKSEARDLPSRFSTRAPHRRLTSPQPLLGQLASRIRLSPVVSQPLGLASPALGATFLQVQSSSPGWPQFGRDTQHTGTLNTVGQNLDAILADIQYDFNVQTELANSDGDLLVHFQTPLVDGNDVFMMSKDGSWTKNNYNTQRWHQNGFTWQNGQLVKAWTFDTDWVAPGSSRDFWEPVYHAALANGYVYDPGGAGTVYKLNRASGAVVRRINPFSDINTNRYTASPLTVDSAGNIFYNVVEIHSGGSSFYSNDVVDSWLVKVAADDTVTKVSYTVLLSTAQIKGEAVPAGTALCKAQFADSQLPWPPTPDAVPPMIACGTQRAALNIAPAIAADGTIYTVSRAHFASRYNYLIAVNPNLTGKWAASLRGRLNDGCNDGTNASSAVLPLNGTAGGCRVGAHPGVDPGTNEPPPGRVIDDGSATPTVGPDGAVYFGAYTRYNWAQGHLMKFSAAGDFQRAYGFGWDTTPGIYRHGGTYSLVTKENHYSETGSYCNVDAVCPPDRSATYPNNPEAYFVTQLNKNFNVEWMFQNHNTLSCQRQPDGSVTCVSDHPNGFEWCINALAIDANGVVYGNSEDGRLYAINQGGTLKASIFQSQTIGAAYTPASLGNDGKIYSQNSGHLIVVGNNPMTIASRTWRPFKVVADGK